MDKPKQKHMYVSDAKPRIEDMPWKIACVVVIFIILAVMK